MKYHINDMIVWEYFGEKLTSKIVRLYPKVSARLGIEINGKYASVQKKEVISHHTRETHPEEFL